MGGQVIREAPCPTRAGRFDASLDKLRGLGGDAARVEEALEGLEDAPTPRHEARQQLRVKAQARCVCRPHDRPLLGEAQQAVRRPRASRPCAPLERQG